uniref:Uncharacterized protein n=1 Tax=Romanomermis culicivorax TaxID=13658 RepID=A0A915I5E3_ROMCU
MENNVTQSWNKYEKRNIRSWANIESNCSSKIDDKSVDNETINYRLSAGFETNSLKRFNIVVEKLNNSENQSSTVLIDQYVDLRTLFNDETTVYRLCNSSLLLMQEEDEEEEGEATGCE